MKCSAYISYRTVPYHIYSIQLLIHSLVSNQLLDGGHDSSALCCCWHTLLVSWLGALCVSSLTSQLLHSETDTGNHALLGLTDPYTGIVELLVGLLISVGVSNLTLKVITVGSLELTKSVPVSPLGISINIHLDDSVLDGLSNLRIGGSGSSVHDKEDGSLKVRSNLLLGVFLVGQKLLGREGYIAGLVNSVNISKGGSDGKHGSNFGKGLVD
mmetsp:Transcript_11188/g.16984  ORF Transcript_11188/g.16984 Transcript_11188/m.16984 type:complete len:213 (-) Transcript_11188:668-1306(-)